MSLPLIFRPEAQADLLAARDGYELQRGALGTAFMDAVDALLTRIQATPELYAAAHKGVRRAKVRRFPYVVFYRLLTDRIEVVAVLHGSRDPQVWQDRV